MLLIELPLKVLTWWQKLSFLSGCWILHPPTNAKGTLFELIIQVFLCSGNNLLWIVKSHFKLLCATEKKRKFIQKKNFRLWTDAETNFAAILISSTITVDFIVLVQHLVEKFLSSNYVVRKLGSQLIILQHFMQ